MFSSLIEASILNFGAARITELAIGIMLLVFFVSVALRVANRAGRFTAYSATLLTSIGILGTFCGIVAGLLGFEISDIDGSIDLLLAGMKTAFITSLVGMLLSIMFKLFLSAWRVPKSNPGTGSVGIKDLYEVMRAQGESLKQLNAAVAGDDEGSLVGQLKFLKADANDHRREHLRILSENQAHAADLQELVQNQSEHLQQLNQAVGGDGEGSLVGQLKFLKSDANDRHREHMDKLAENQQRFDNFQDHLHTQMREFADTLSKSATEQVIEALKQVITDFNNNLTEQFGDNFKELNVAVGRLLEWQENYKQQMAEMHQQYEQGVKAIGHTQQAVASIEVSAKAIPESMQALEAVITTNQEQVETLGGHLGAFGKMRDRATEAMPAIKSTLEGMKNASDTFKSLATDSENVTKQLRESGKAVIEQSSKSQKEFENGMQKMQKDLKDSMERTATDSGNIIRGQVEQLDDKVSVALSSVMTKMGNALGQITGLISDEYEDMVAANQSDSRRSRG